MKSVLVIENDSNDIYLLRHLLEKIDPSLEVLSFCSGELALDFLLGRGEYRDRVKHPLPCLIFLDLNMPRTSGFEILRRIKKEPGLKLIPVVISSGSSQTQDIDHAYDLGANLYLVKKVNSQEMFESVKSIIHLFLSNAGAQNRPTPLELAT